MPLHEIVYYSDGSVGSVILHQHSFPEIRRSPYVHFVRFLDNYIITHRDEWRRLIQDKYNPLVVGYEELPNIIRHIYAAQNRPGIEILLQQGMLEGFVQQESKRENKSLEENDLMEKDSEGLFYSWIGYIL